MYDILTFLKNFLKIYSVGKAAPSSEVASP